MIEPRPNWSVKLDGVTFVIGTIFAAAFSAIVAAECWVHINSIPTPAEISEANWMRWVIYAETPVCYLISYLLTRRRSYRYILLSLIGSLSTNVVAVLTVQMLATHVRKPFSFYSLWQAIAIFGGGSLLISIAIMLNSKSITLLTGFISNKFGSYRNPRAVHS